MKASDREWLNELWKRKKLGVQDSGYYANPEELRRIKAIIDRDQELADEPLTAYQKERLASWLGRGDYRGGMELEGIVQKLQVALAEADELRRVLLSDPPASREDVVAQVRYETAKEIVGMLVDDMHRTGDPWRSSKRVLQDIFHRFGIAEPKWEGQRTERHSEDVMDRFVEHIRRNP